MSDCIVDLPPEYCQYHDDGCEFEQSCLNCHLPICVYDEPGGKQRLLKRRRAAEMVRLFTSEGKSVGELAQVFGISRRTVQRALKIAFGDKTRKNSANDTDVSFQNQSGIQRVEVPDYRVKPDSDTEKEQTDERGF
jgi:AraC-like DNA-binding protein